MAVVNDKNKQSERAGRVTLSSRRPSTTAYDTDCVPCSTYLSWKSIFDWVLAVVFLVLALPMIGVLMAVVRLTSPGSGLFRQARMGKNGLPFTMYKIRTMTRNAEAQTGPVWARINDPRVTLFGRVLRKLHLDELPQLFNVLRGEMSLVGPRPERPEFVHMLADNIPGYRNRLAARPGVTGLAQLNLPPDSDLDSVRRKLVLDLEYFQQATLLLDIRIILCTAFRVFKLSENMVLRLFGVQRSIAEEKLDRHLPPVDEPSDNVPLPSRRGHPPSDASLKDTCPYALSETLVDIPKHLLEGLDLEDEGLDLDDPKVQQCVERTLQRSYETALHHLPRNNAPDSQPCPKPN